ncbi:DUF1800 family protein [Photobacterium japonica]|uniref:DUF1800 family protein n=1 Tax=Photobacterium japonica TaxID=2910235 RepID=UPI003D0BEAEF
MFFNPLSVLKKAIVVLLFQVIATSAYAVDLIDNGSISKNIQTTHIPYTVNVTIHHNERLQETFDCEISTKQQNRKAQWAYQVSLCINQHSTTVFAGKRHRNGDITPVKSRVRNTLWAPTTDYRVQFSPHYAPDALNYLNASRLLERATFGPTPATVNVAVGQSASDWVDTQMALPPTSHLAEYLRIQQIQTDITGIQQEHRVYRSHAWWGIILNADDQLRQRVAFALSQLLVVSENDAGLAGDDNAKGLAIYYDILVNHAFGQYKDLLRAVTYSPAMGRFLTMAGNLPPDPDTQRFPDENYARELLQLFTLGEWKTSYKGITKTHRETGVPRPAYHERDVQALARLFTGWDESNGLLSPMVVTPANHDTDPKRILGKRFPGNESAEEELDRLLDILIAKRETAVFVSRHLIKQLVTSNPSPQYLKRVARTFHDTQGDLGAVVKAILTDPHAYLIHPLAIAKAREPILTTAALYRALNGEMGQGFTHHNDVTLGYGYQRSESPEKHRFSQGPLAAPSVFNFFPATYRPSGPLEHTSLVGPEFALYSTAEIPALANLLYRKLKEDVTFDGDVVAQPETRLILDYSAFTPLWKANDKAGFLQLLANTLFHGTLTPQLEHRLSTRFDALPKDTHDEMHQLFWLAAMSPEFQIQE